MKNNDKKINLNRPKIKSDEIKANKDFASLLSQHKAMASSPKSPFKGYWFIGTVTIVLLTITGLTFWNFSKQNTETENLSENNFVPKKEYKLPDTNSQRQDNIVSEKQDVPKSKEIINHTPQNDFTYQPKNSNKFNAPFPELDIPNDYYTVNVDETPQVVNHHTGTEIFIPKNAFVRKDGTPVTGNVEIEYREFHDQIDVMLSGIPMDYDVNGEKQYFESAGMLQIEARQGNEELQLAKGKKIDFKMHTEKKEEQFNLYQFNQRKGKWILKGKDSLVNGKTENTNSSIQPSSSNKGTSNFTRNKQNFKSQIFHSSFIPLYPSKFKNDAVKNNMDGLSFVESTHEGDTIKYIYQQAINNRIIKRTNYDGFNDDINRISDYYIKPVFSEKYYSEGLLKWKYRGHIKLNRLDIEKFPEILTSRGLYFNIETISNPKKAFRRIAKKAIKENKELKIERIDFRRSEKKGFYIIVFIINGEKVTAYASPVYSKRVKKYVELLYDYKVSEKRKSLKRARVRREYIKLKNYKIPNNGTDISASHYIGVDKVSRSINLSDLYKEGVPAPIKMDADSLLYQEQISIKNGKVIVERAYGSLTPSQNTKIKISRLEREINHFKSKEPIKPVQIDDGKENFVLKLNTRNFPEIAEANDIAFEVANLNEYQKINSKYPNWKSKGFKRSDIKGQFFLEIDCNETLQDSIYVYPAFPASSMEQANDSYQQKMIHFNNELDKKLKIKDSLDTLVVQQIAQEKTWRQSMNSMYGNNADRFNYDDDIRRAFGIDQMGTWNCDSPHPKGTNSVKLKGFVNKNNNKVNLIWTYVMETDKNRGYSLNPWSTKIAIYGKRTILIGKTDDEKFAYCENLNPYKTNKKKIKLTIIDDKKIDIDDLKEIILNGNKEILEEKEIKPPSSNEKKFKLYPNPNNGEFNISCNESINKANIQIFNIGGGSVYAKEHHFEGSSVRIVNPLLNSGTFLVRITHNGKSETHKMIVQK